MEKNNLNEMKLGWFVGDFNPSLFKTQDVEVAIKKYEAGKRDLAHYHKIATEITVIIEGKAIMNGVEYNKDDIITIYPNEVSSFIAIEDVTLAVVKIPGEKNDKYMSE